MRNLLVLLLLASLLPSIGCDNFMVMGAINQSTFAGTVTIVRLTVTGDGTQVTLVTLVESMQSRDFTFCGNVVNQFPMNTSVQGSFNPGSPCGTIVRVTVQG